TSECQSPDLNPIEMLWHDLKKAVHIYPHNLTELECSMLVDSYPRHTQWI
uniref:Tc1-like transposase DDE domain-containing protein n=1 Tax=Denticeps clupeoides TaxID=299321 RepID=A0AAY4E280_9TELE